ncbi:hypothetical protein [Amycolatopsis pigmentata]|uniref:Excreted virulence factor EspC (Type VII ESX diderm) n=1 Tax=Amycolatopsis pigmentata TaxID=450801 RepID=A0ABW5FTW8_9PSEU
MAIIEDGGSSTGLFGGVIGAAVQAVDAGVSSAALAQAQQAAQGLKDAASAGKIRISEAGFNSFMQALNDCDAHLQDLRRNVSTVAQAPKLGTSDYAQKVAAHVQKGGTGLTQSADAVADQLGEILNTTRDALNQARKAYQENEHGNVQVLK